MKESIRRNVFETNSSSTHSLTMCSAQEYEDWKNGKLLKNRYDGEFIPVKKITTSDEEFKKLYFEEYSNKVENGYIYKNKYYATIEEMILQVEIGEKEIEQFKAEACENEDSDYVTYEKFWDYYSDEYETFEKRYITKSGEEIVSFGYYGYDG